MKQRFDLFVSTLGFMSWALRQPVASAASRLAASLSCGLLLLLVSPANAQVTDVVRTPPVRTTSGLVTGIATGDGIAFKGIPFAAPPTGALRWRSPAPPIPWDGVRTADEFGPPCAQSPLRGMTAISDLSREDCLHLNIWTPDIAPEARLPVMVWIHGGGFANGMASSPTYDGGNFASRGVILVTINYRLGVLGFLAHPELSAEAEHRASGNFGLEDQVAALRWVVQNIAAFGGDPGNITLFGQSAGGASVHDLMVSPLSEGLFARAIIQSGVSRQGMAASSLEQAEEAGLAFAQGLSIADLRTLDTAAVLDRSERVAAAGRRFAPLIDGYVIPDDPMAVLAGQLPLLIGSNSREGLGVVRPDQLEAEVMRAFGANSEQALLHYGIGNQAAVSVDPVLGTAEQQFATDATFRCGNVHLAHRNASSGGPTWQYQFEQLVPGKEEQGAAHSFEVPYVFGNLSSIGFSAADYGVDDRRLSDLMIGYWVSFAEDGDPNGEGLPPWPQYTVGGTEYLRFSTALPSDAEVRTDLGGAICSLFD